MRLSFGASFYLDYNLKTAWLEYMIIIQQKLHKIRLLQRITTEIVYADKAMLSGVLLFAVCILLKLEFHCKQQRFTTFCTTVCSA